MIELNGKKFAANDKEFVNSLFNTNGTCVGYYRKYSKSIVLMDMQKNRVGVINRHGCLCCATKVDNGYWYSFADIDLIGKYDSYGQQTEECQNALNK